MKVTIFFSLLLLFLSGCSKKDDPAYEPGKILSNINYTNSVGTARSEQSKSNGSKSDSFYTIFGDYVTSVTPKVFRAKFHTIRFQEGISLNNLMEIVENNLPGTDPLRYADFALKSSVKTVPKLWGELINDGASFGRVIDFHYFYFRIQFFYLEVELPSQYSSITSFSQFNFTPSDDENVQMGGSLTDNIIKAKHFMFLYPLYETAQVISELYVFGNTDSTFLHKVEEPGNTVDNPMDEHTTYIIRSHKYNILTFTPPEDGKTTSINTNLNFDYNNLIQIYAGPDNIPYTQDDRFLFCPNYWERLSVQVDID